MWHRAQSTEKLYQAQAGARRQRRQDRQYLCSAQSMLWIHWSVLSGACLFEHLIATHPPSARQSAVLTQSASYVITRHCRQQNHSRRAQRWWCHSRAVSRLKISCSRDRSRFMERRFIGDPGLLLIDRPAARERHSLVTTLILATCSFPLEHRMSRSLANRAQRARVAWMLA